MAAALVARVRKPSSSRAFRAVSAALSPLGDRALSGVLSVFDVFIIAHSCLYLIYCNERRILDPARRFFLKFFCNRFPREHPARGRGLQFPGESLPQVV